MIGGTSNVSNLVALRAAQMNSLSLWQSLNRLATGSRINRAADHPAGLIASLQMDATLAALDAETAINQRAVNVADTADAALGQISDLLAEAKSLVAANANSGALSSGEKQANQLEIDSILASVDRIARATSFNGKKLLDGSGRIAASGVSLSIASARSADIGATEIGGRDYVLSDLSSGAALDTTGDNVGGAAKVVDAAIGDIAMLRGRIGAFSRNTIQPRLVQLAGSRQHLMSTVSMIRDTDYAMQSSAMIRSELLLRGSMLLLRRSNALKGMLLSVLA